MEVQIFEATSPAREQMGKLLSNLKLTDNEDSDVELVNVRTMMEELRLKEFQPQLSDSKSIWNNLLLFLIEFDSGSLGGGNIPARATSSHFTGHHACSLVIHVSHHGSPKNMIRGL